MPNYKHLYLDLDQLVEFGYFCPAVYNAVHLREVHDSGINNYFVADLKVLL